MKIIQFMASEGWGGAEMVFVELANELAKEHDVVALLLRKTVYARRFSPQVRIIELQSNPTRYNPFLSLEIYSVIKDLQPDIVHTHAVKGSELVSFVNNFFKFNHVGTKHNVRKGKIFNKMKWVTAVSRAVEGTIHTVQKFRPRIIHNGLSLEIFEQAKKNTEFTIMAVGRLDKIKGFDCLIDQVKDLPFNFQLWIVGDGPEKENLHQLIVKYGLKDKVFLCGHREDIPLMMGQAHVVVISSHSEGFSKVAIEALCYADVLISTPVGICLDFLPGRLKAEQGFLGDKIRDIYYQYDNYKEAFAVIKQEKKDDFLLPTIVRQYVDLYDHIIRCS